MDSKVALVKTTEDFFGAFRRALDLIGGIDDLNSKGRVATIKVGIFDERNLNYPTIQIVRAVVESFSRSKEILLAESDNYQGKALERLRVWREIFSDRVIPFDLSHDSNVREALICGENVRFSHVLFKPNVLVSLHVLRKGTSGSIFKNLLGLIPDVGKDRFHGELGVALVDIAEAVGWIDLAVMDGTFSYGGEWKMGEPLERERRDFLLVGRDPAAVETVGSVLVGEDPLSIPSLAVVRERKLGETEFNRIEILGESMENLI
jgi:uncharacterized protein (DUF362 family)